MNGIKNTILLCSLMSAGTVAFAAKGQAAQDSELSFTVMPSMVAGTGHDYARFRKGGLTDSQSTRDLKTLYATNDPGISFELAYNSKIASDYAQSFSFLSSYIHTTGHIVGKTGNAIYPTQLWEGGVTSGEENGMNSANDSARSKLNATVQMADYSIGGNVFQNQSFGNLMLHAGIKGGYIHHRMKTIYNDASAGHDEVDDYNDVYGVGPKLGLSWNQKLGSSKLDFSTSLFSSFFLAHHRNIANQSYYTDAGILQAGESMRNLDDAYFDVLPVIDFNANVAYSLDSFNAFKDGSRIELGYKLQDWMNLNHKTKFVDDTDASVSTDTRKDFIIHGPYLRFSIPY